MTDTLNDAAETIGKALHVNEEAAKVAHEKAQKTTIETAQQLYKTSLQPIFNALAQLPGKDGKKFTLAENFGENIKGVSVYLQYGDDYTSTWASLHFKGERPGEKYPVTIYFNSLFQHKEQAVYGIKGAALLFSEWVNKQLPDRILEINTILEAVKSRRRYVDFADRKAGTPKRINLKYP